MARCRLCQHLVPFDDVAVGDPVSRCVCVRCFAREVERMRTRIASEIRAA
jgi:hypothetical protein